MSQRNLPSRTSRNISIGNNPGSETVKKHRYSSQTNLPSPQGTVILAKILDQTYQPKQSKKEMRKIIKRKNSSGSSPSKRRIGSKSRTDRNTREKAHENEDGEEDEYQITTVLNSRKPSPHIHHSRTVSKLENPIVKQSMPNLSGTSSVAVKELLLNEDIEKETLKMRKQSNETGVMNRNVPNHVPSTFHISDLLSPTFAAVGEYQLKKGAPNAIIRRIRKEGSGFKQY